MRCDDWHVILSIMRVLAGNVRTQEGISYRSVLYENVLILSLTAHLINNLQSGKEILLKPLAISDVGCAGIHN